MASVNMRGLRDTRRLKAWLRAGETVTLRDRKQVIARIVPQKQASVKWPDFQNLRKEIFGDRLLPGADLLLKERGRF